jgi:DNA mismatch endonuclease Vsr
MAQIRQKNTRPEIMVRSILHRLGYRFTLRRKDLPGHPDVVLPSLKSVSFCGRFVDGNPIWINLQSKKHIEIISRLSVVSKLNKDRSEFLAILE